MRTTTAVGPLAVLALLTLVACGGSDEPSTYLPATITCTTQARAADGTGPVESASITVDRIDGFGESERGLAVGPFDVTLAFEGEAPEGHTVLIRVVGESGDVLVQDLFQYGGTDALRTGFAGGHGFTGLRYVYDDDAELQYFCAAQP